MKIRTVALATALFTTTTVAAFAQGFSDKDKSFLKDVAQGNMAEVKMGELVVKTSKNPTVLAFAQQMIKDHTALLDGVKTTAAKAGVSLPTGPSIAQDATYAKLKLETGETFDKGYVKSMVDDHKEDLDEVKKENVDTSNPDMKKLTSHAATVIAMHKAKIDSIAMKMGVK